MHFCCAWSLSMQIEAEHHITSTEADIGTWNGILKSSQGSYELQHAEQPSILRVTVCRERANILSPITCRETDIETRNGFLISS